MNKLLPSPPLLFEIEFVQLSTHFMLMWVNWASIGRIIDLMFIIVQLFMILRGKLYIKFNIYEAQFRYLNLCLLELCSKKSKKELTITSGRGFGGTQLSATK